MYFHPYVILLFISALTSLTISIIILRREAPGATTLGGVLLGTFVWGAAAAMSEAVTGLDEKIFWLKVMYFGITAIPSLFLYFTLKITHNEKWLTWRNSILLSIEPVATVLVVWFAFPLLLSHVEIRGVNGYLLLSITRGAWFWFNTLYSYALILLALSVLIISSLRANPFFRRQYLIVLLGSVIPFAASLYTQISYREFSNFDLSPISFGVASILFAYAIFRHQFMDLLPVARGRLIENMSDGVLVIDEQGRIVDANPAMLGILRETSTSFIGKKLSEVMRGWMDTDDPLWGNNETRTELRLRHDASRYMDLRMTPLYDHRERLNGRVIVFRDITDRKRAEREILLVNDRLHTQLVEIGILQNQLREQAIRDPLTDLFNRRYLDETLERELSRAEREGYPLCIMMMDIDHFKDVNDTYGHEAGDVVLRALADTVTAQSRHGDFACRYGGEEFVLVMPNIILGTAIERAQHLHRDIQQMNIPYGRFNLSATISMGIALYPEHGTTRDELLRAADQALYDAKRAGRNRVSVYEPETQVSQP